MLAAVHGRSPGRSVAASAAGRTRRPEKNMRKKSENPAPPPSDVRNS